MALIHDHKREGAFPGRGDLHHRHLEATLVGALVVDGPGDAFGHEVRVGRRPPDSEALSQLGGVGQVPVVPEGDARGTDLSMGRLGVGPIVGAGGGVAGVSDAEMTVQTGEGGLVEDLGHEAQVLEHRDRLPVRRRNAGRLLAPVLEAV